MACCYENVTQKVAKEAMEEAGAVRKRVHVLELIETRAISWNEN